MTEQPQGHAIIYTFKIPLPDKTIHNPSIAEDTLRGSKWVMDVYQIFSDCINEVQEKKKNFDKLQGTLSPSESLACIELSLKHSESIAAIVSALDHEL
jgi:hypothetical protein